MNLFLIDLSRLGLFYQLNTMEIPQIKLSNFLNVFTLINEFQKTHIFENQISSLLNPSYIFTIDILSIVLLFKFLPFKAYLSEF